MNKQDIIIYKTTDDKTEVALYARDGNVWMNQNQLAQLFATSKPNISMHISNILKEQELGGDSVVKDYLTTAPDGKEYNVTFYSLEMILAIGFRVRSKRGIQFRKWANRNLKEYMVKGFVMDDQRLKKEGNETVTNCHGLKMRVVDGKWWALLRKRFAAGTVGRPTGLLLCKPPPSCAWRCYPKHKSFYR